MGTLRHGQGSDVHVLVGRIPEFFTVCMFKGISLLSEYLAAIKKEVAYVL